MFGAKFIAYFDQLHNELQHVRLTLFPPQATWGDKFLQAFFQEGLAKLPSLDPSVPSYATVFFDSALLSREVFVFTNRATAEKGKELEARCAALAAQRTERSKRIRTHSGKASAVDRAKHVCHRWLQGVPCTASPCSYLHELPAGSSREAELAKMQAYIGRNRGKLPRK